MKRAIAPVIAALAIAFASGCATEPAAPEPATTSTAGADKTAPLDIEDDEVAPTTPTSAPTLEGSSTIREVWTKIGCAEDDFMGTGGVIGLSEPRPPVELSGMCTPYEDGNLVFFFQLPGVDDVPAWLASGALEVGPTDAVFIDGAVVILTTDAGTTQKFNAIFESAG